MGAKDIQVCWSTGLIPSLRAWAAQIKHRQPSDKWLINSSGWALPGRLQLQSSAAAHNAGKLLFAGKTAEGQNLRAVLQLFLQGPDPAEESGEIMIKSPSEEEQCCHPRLTDHPECSRFPVAAPGRKGGTVSRWHKVSFCCTLQFSGLPETLWFAGHPPILLAIALGSECAAERVLQEQHPPTPKVKFW